MPFRLIYHSQESRQQNVSPFKDAIGQIVKGNIRIACPYLSIPQLREIISPSDSWELLTDIHAWIDACEKNHERVHGILSFVEENRRSIRHYPNLHAKVIITSNAALFGSANFTDTGLNVREEISAIVEDADVANELNSWFQQLWDLTYIINDDEILSISGYLDECKKYEPNISHGSKNKIKFRGLKKVEHQLPALAKTTIDGKRLSPISQLAAQIAIAGSIEKMSARYWIYYMIRNGKLAAYKFRDIYLLDDAAIEQIWQARDRIDDGRKNTYSHMPKDITITEIQTGQLLTLADVANQTGKSKLQIQKLIDAKDIVPLFKEKMYIFEPSVIDDIKAIPPKPKGREKLINPNANEISRLKPLTKLERFAISRNQEGYSEQQIIDAARALGITTSIFRERARQALHKAIQKQKAAEIIGEDIFSLDHTIQLKANRVGRKKRELVK